jgi:hypothetical protein
MLIRKQRYKTTSSRNQQFTDTDHQINQENIKTKTENRSEQMRISIEIDLT